MHGLGPCDPRSNRGWQIYSNYHIHRKGIIITYLYLLKSDDKYKIGVSNNPEDRINQLQTGCPYTISLVTKEKFDSKKYAHEIEDRLHKQLSDYREEGEWFDIKGTIYVKSIKDYGFDTTQSIISKIDENTSKPELYSKLISLHDRQIESAHDVINTIREQFNNYQDEKEDELFQIKLFLVIILILGVIF